MATDARGHTVPTGAAPARRQDLLDLSLSIHDIVPVANATARAQALTDLGSSPDRPLIVRQQDTGAYWEHTGGGSSDWRVLSAGPSHPITPAAPYSSDASLGPRWCYVGDYVELDGVILRSGAIPAAPAGITGAGAVPAPVMQQQQPVAMWGSTSGTPGTGMIVVRTDGQLQAAERTGSCDRISLAGVRYRWRA